MTNKSRRKRQHKRLVNQRAIEPTVPIGCTEGYCQRTELIKYVNTLLSQLMSQSNTQLSWQLIESAPKDGAEILAYEDGMIYVTHWVSFANGFGQKMEGWIDPDTSELGPYLSWPTHWMPLPKPPAPYEGE